MLLTVVEVRRGLKRRGWPIRRVVGARGLRMRGWVALPSVCERDASADERAALDTVRAVEDFTRYERLTPSGQGDTADWRVWMEDGRVADVEVTRFVDQGTRDLLAAGHDRKWPARELSHEWMVQVSDLVPEQNRSLQELVGALTPVLRDVEAGGGTASEMIARVNQLLNANSPPGSRMVQEVAWLLGRSVTAYGCEPAEPDGGSVTTFVSAAVGGNLSTTTELAAAIQGRIDKKQEQGQLEAAPGLRWLVVVLDEFTLAQMQLRAFAEETADESHTVSAADSVPESAAPLGEITFPCMDEVWAVGPSRSGDWVFVLRLVEAGSNWQVAALKSADALGDNWYAVPGLTFWRH